MSFYIYKNSEQTGPFEESLIQSELRKGNLLPQDLACSEGTEEWLPLYTFFPDEAQFQTLSQPVRHETPKCLCCGTVTSWKIEPLLLSRHIMVFFVLLCAAGAGLLYLPMICILRMNSNTRAKICPSCGARNMWTFQY